LLPPVVASLAVAFTIMMLEVVKTCELSQVMLICPILSVPTHGSEPHTAFSKFTVQLAAPIVQLLQEVELKLGQLMPYIEVQPDIVVLAGQVAVPFVCSHAVTLTLVLDEEAKTERFDTIGPCVSVLPPPVAFDIERL